MYMLVAILLSIIIYYALDHCSRFPPIMLKICSINQHLLASYTLCSCIPDIKINDFSYPSYAHSIFNQHILSCQSFYSMKSQLLATFIE